MLAKNPKLAYENRSAIHLLDLLGIHETTTTPHLIRFCNVDEIISCDGNNQKIRLHSVYVRGTRGPCTPLMRREWTKVHLDLSVIA